MSTKKVLGKYNDGRKSVVGPMGQVELVQEPEPVAATQSSGAAWRDAFLAGPYLKRTRCQVLITADRTILDSDLIHSVFSGKPEFDQWFRDLYHPIVFKS